MPDRQQGDSRRRPGAARRPRTRFIRPPGLPGIEIVGMSDRRLPTSLYSDRYGIIVCASGDHDRHHAVGPVRGLCPPMLLEPGMVHPAARACPCEGVWALFVEPSTLLQFAAARGLTLRGRLRITVDEYAPLVTAVYAFWAAVEKGVPASEQRARLESCLESMLHLMVEPAPTGHMNHPAVMAARDYLRRRVHETITLEELARISRMSRFHLVRAFAAHVGLPPHAYQTRLRLERAMALLRAGLRPGEVATLTGFADQSHLTRHFRRIVGVTPGEYAKGA